jgi:hypothetical protein
MKLPRPVPSDRRGFLQADLVVALILLTATILPLAYSFVAEQRALRHGYERAVAMQLVDGEMERLVAGAWREYPAGTNRLALTGNAAVNLASREATLILTDQLIRLEWQPLNRPGGRVIREAQRP